MSIVNRRNAVLGWSVWQVGKRVAKKKARQVAPSARTGAAAAGALGALAAGLLFWRRRGGESSDSS